MCYNENKGGVNMPLKIVLGDITEIKCDAIVNFYMGQFGSDSDTSKIIHALGGDSLRAECQEIKKCFVGSSVITTAFGIKSNYIVHTVAPTAGEDFEHNLAKCYKSSFSLCNTKGLCSVSYPLIFSDSFPVSIEKSIKIALNRIATNLQRLNKNMVVCLVVPNVETLNMTLAIAKEIVPEEYYTTEEIPLLEKKNSVILSDNMNLQEQLIENYEMLRSGVTEKQIGEEAFKQWITMVETIYEEIILLKNEEWNNPTELKEVSKRSKIWDIIKLIFNEKIGIVNGYNLRISGDVVCLLMAYATPKNGQTNVTEERFRVKFEYYLARCIIEQKSKSPRLLKDEHKDRNSIRKLRKINKASLRKETEKGSETIKWEKNSVLYIYKGNIRCHRYGHTLIQTTAVLHSKTDDEIIVNIEYCTECKKFLLEYTLFEEYRNRFGVLIGNFRMAVNGVFDGEYFVAQESPLMLSGYNVGQRDDYTSNERHYILARLIYDGIMSKGEIVRYLSYFIRKNGAKKGNEFALSKWREDLAFVQSYNINIQPRVVISHIRKY